MLRPATPLSVLLLISTGLLTLSVLSTPIIKGVPIGSFSGYDYGVFGYCKGDDCSGFEIGYSVTAETTDSSDFDLPGSTRDTLTTILIVHPVAAVMSLLTLVMAFIAHLHSPAHSSRYLLVVAITNFLAFIVSLLSFLIDVLVFIPHLAWGSYLVLGATIVLFLCSIMTCAMRRTLVSRKSRKKQIAQHAEMSGENYYNREAALKAANVAPAESIPAIPTMTGADSAKDDGIPAFATFEKSKAPSDTMSDRIPLTSQSPVQRSASVAQQVDQYGNPMRSDSGDQYGSSINSSPPRAYNNVARNGSGDSYRGRGPQGRGGRGGYGGNGRGGYNGQNGYGGPNGPNGYGAPNGYNGYNEYNGPDQRGMPPRRGTNNTVGSGRGAAPQGYRQDSMYNNQGYTGTQEYQPPQDPYTQNNVSQQNVGFNQQRNSVNNQNFVPYSNRQLSIDSYNALKARNPNANPQDFDFGLDAPADQTILPRAESPPPMPAEMVANAVTPMDIDGSSRAPIEMDASPAAMPLSVQNMAAALREDTPSVPSALAIQPGLMPEEPRQTYIGDVSKYSQDGPGMAPPSVANWNPAGARPSALPAPLALGATSNVPMPQMPPNTQAYQPEAEAAYYEDIPAQYTQDHNGNPLRPHNLMLPPPEVTIEDIPGNLRGPRSPGAESDVSNFTSISQRGINPAWQPEAPPMPGYSGQGGGYGPQPYRGPPGPRGPGPRGPPRGPPQAGPKRPPAQQKQDILLNSNPDFALPGRR